MGSLNSFGLWGSLAAVGVAVPVIIHLLYRKQRKQTPWAAMELLRRALVDRSGQVKLEDFLILFLRCLALVLIALALLRPTLTGSANSLLGEQRVGMVVGIDASFSMGHGLHSRFEKAIARTKEILATAKDGDPVSLVLMSQKPEVLLRSTGYESSRFSGVLDAQEKPTAYGLTLEQNIEGLAELVDEMKTPIKECYLVTDAQESDWGALSDKGKQTLERLTRDASVFVVPVDTDSEANVSLTALRYSSGALRKGEVARFTAMVKNQGRQSVDGGKVEFHLNDTLVSRQAVGKLDAGESRGVSFFASFVEAGDVRMKAMLSKDDLAIDDARYAVARIREQVRVLCVDGTKGGGETGERRGVYYAARALRLKQRGEKAPLKVVQIETAGLSAERLSDFDMIVLANVDDVSPEMVKRLHTFVSKGGGLMFFVGDQVKAEDYNQRFGFDANGLLPGKLGEVAAADEESTGWPLVVGRTGHRLASVVELVEPKLVDLARFKKVMGVEVGEGNETILKVAHQEMPLLVEKTIGQGNVLLFTSTADRTWGDFAVHPLYTMLIQQSVTQLTSKPDGWQVAVGSSVNVATPGRVVGSEAAVTDPAGEKRMVTVAEVNGQTVCPVEMSRVGVYSVAEAGEAPGASMASNVDARESNVQVVDGGAVESKVKELGVKVVTGGGSMASMIEESRRGYELTTFLLVMGILVFLLQSVLARYFTNRQTRGQSDLGESLQMARVAAARRA